MVNPSIHDESSIRSTYNPTSTPSCPQHISHSSSWTTNKDRRPCTGLGSRIPQTVFRRSRLLQRAVRLKTRSRCSRMKLRRGRNKPRKEKGITYSELLWRGMRTLVDARSANIVPALSSTSPNPPLPTRFAIDIELWQSPFIPTSTVIPVQTGKNRHRYHRRRISMPSNAHTKSLWTRKNEPSTTC